MGAILYAFAAEDSEKRRKKIKKEEGEEREGKEELGTQDDVS